MFVRVQDLLRGSRRVMGTGWTPQLGSNFVGEVMA